jgi:hypothetical protein
VIDHLRKSAPWVWQFQCGKHLTVLSPCGVSAVSTKDGTSEAGTPAIKVATLNGTPLTWENDSIVSTRASFGTTHSSHASQAMRTTAEDPQLTTRTREPDLSALIPSLTIEAVDQQMEKPIQTWHSESTPSSGSGRLAPLVEEPLDLETGAPSTPPSSIRGRQSKSHPTSSAPAPSHPIPSAPQRQSTADSPSLQSMSDTEESGTQGRWSLMNHIRSRTTLNTTPDVSAVHYPQALRTVILYLYNREHRRSDLLPRAWIRQPLLAFLQCPATSSPLLALRTEQVYVRIFIICGAPNPDDTLL